MAPVLDGMPAEEKRRRFAEMMSQLVAERLEQAASRRVCSGVRALTLSRIRRLGTVLPYLLAIRSNSLAV